MGLNFSFRGFFKSHPDIIAAVKNLEHAGFNGAEDFILSALEAEIPLIGGVLDTPLRSIVDPLKQKAESAIDSGLDSLTQDPAPASGPAVPTPAAPAPAATQRRGDTPANTVNVVVDPRTAAKQQMAAVRNAQGESPTGELNFNDNSQGSVTGDGNP